MLETEKEREIIRARKAKRHTYSTKEIKEIFQRTERTLQECGKELERLRFGGQKEASVTTTA
jgi:hypothetical protein